ncbi:unnamed protein product [Spirodela intermedia]|uniref:CRAL-TRIO domain-containing protein n=1 Tax=Spirodela intermedia TaxID=51605 RepID=A0A7I8IZV5_SPIIN|nr:unnamed protein product [Spirodela intermedia]CAA6663252.1 unnamed protein product [Spirodela intermedia]
MEEEDEGLFRLLDELEVFEVQGRDKRGRRILRVVGKFFPVFGEEDLPELLGKKGKGGPFVIVYVHTYVQRLENFPGPLAGRPDNLEAVFFVHPGLQSRLFFATFGRFLFSAGLYGKLRYMNRLEFLWEHIRRGEVEVPEFVLDHDEELEHRPLMDYGLESDYQHHRAYDAPAMDSASSMHSLRCIS